MTLQRWLTGAGWGCLCGLGAIGVLADLTTAAAWVVLAPFALIGFLVGPSSNLDLSRFVPTIALWVQKASGLSAPASARPAPGEEAPSPERLGRLKRRADIVAVRERGTSVLVATDDAAAKLRELGMTLR